MRRIGSPSGFAVATLMILMAVTSAWAQDQSKVLVWAPENPNWIRADPTWARQIDAIELENIFVAGKTITIGEPFAADSDWIRDLTFRIKNVSASVVTFAQITLTLPQLTHSIQIPYLVGSFDKKVVSLSPGEEVELKIPPGKLYQWVKDSVAREMEFSRISKAALALVYVTSESRGNEHGLCVRVVDSRNACRTALK